MASPLQFLGPSLGVQPPELEDGESPLRQVQAQSVEPPSEPVDEEDSYSDGQSPDNFGPAIDAEGLNSLASSLRKMSARQEYRNQLMEMINRPRERAGSLNLPMLQFAAGLLKPTRSGTLGEAISGAAPAALAGVQDQRQLDLANQNRQDAMKLQLLGDQAEDERSDENRLFQMMLAKYGKNPMTKNTKEGVMERQPDGSWKKIGDLPGSTTMATVPLGDGPEGPGVYRVDPSGNMRKLGELTPNQQTPTQMYERKEDTLSAERDDKFVSSVMERGENAIKQNQAIEGLASMLEETPLQGAAAPSVNAILSFAQTFGFDPKDFNLPSASPGEVARGLTARVTLDKSGGSLGAGISNADRDFLEYTFPRLGNTEAANKALAAMMRRLNQREIEVMRFAEQYQVDKGTVRGLRKAINDQFGGKSIFDEDGKGQFTKSYFQELATAKPGTTIKDMLTQQGAPAAARLELQYRRNQITKEQRDEGLKKLGY